MRVRTALLVMALGVLACALPARVETQAPSFPMASRVVLTQSFKRHNFPVRSVLTPKGNKPAPDTVIDLK